MDAVNVLLDAIARTGVDLRSSFATMWLGLALWQYILVLILIIAALFARKVAALLLERLVLPSLKRLGGNLASRIGSALTQPLTAFVGLFGVYLAVGVLLIPTSQREPVIPGHAVQQIFEVSVAVIVIWAAMRVVDAIGHYFNDQAKHNQFPVEAPVIPLLQKSLKFFVAIVGTILVIQELGYPIASLLGGLGIGGLAVALAAQDTIANVFGSIIVFTDKPFKVGDWVKIGDVEGFVETIGFRSTRIRTWPRTLVFIPNKTISNTQIENFSAMPIRRNTFTFRIAYGASADQIEALVKGIREILATHPGVDQGFHLVNFTEFGDNGLGIFVYYFTKSTVWREHMEVRQEVNLAIMRLVESLDLTLGVPERRVRVAFPGQTGGDAHALEDPPGGQARS